MSFGKFSFCLFSCKNLRIFVTSTYLGLFSNYILFGTEAEADTGFPERRGVGCRGYGYFILGLSVVGHITRCMDKMSVDKILGDQTPVKIARGGQNAVHFMGQGGQNAYLNKTLYI